MERQTPWGWIRKVPREKMNCTHPWVVVVYLTCHPLNMFPTSDKTIRLRWTRYANWVIYCLLGLHRSDIDGERLLRNKWFEISLRGTRQCLDDGFDQIKWRRLKTQIKSVNKWNNAQCIRLVIFVIPIPIFFPIFVYGFAPILTLN